MWQGNIVEVAHFIQAGLLQMKISASACDSFNALYGWNDVKIIFLSCVRKQPMDCVLHECQRLTVTPCIVEVASELLMFDDRNSICIHPCLHGGR